MKETRVDEYFTFLKRPPRDEDKNCSLNTRKQILAGFFYACGVDHLRAKKTLRLYTRKKQNKKERKKERKKKKKKSRPYTTTKDRCCANDYLNL
jgi:hypothetical protein